MGEAPHRELLGDIGEGPLLAQQQPGDKQTSLGKRATPPDSRPPTAASVSRLIIAPVGMIGHSVSSMSCTVGERCSRTAISEV